MSSRASLVQQDAKNDKASGTAHKKIPRSTAKEPRERKGTRLSPGDAALEREADRYAAGDISPTLKQAGTAPKSKRRGGAPLPPDIRGLHEMRLGRDLSDLRIHTGEDARTQTSSQGASALAEHGDVVINPKRFQPETADGQKLISHEVAHTAQQADGRGKGPALKEEPSLFANVPKPLVTRTTGGGIVASLYFPYNTFLLGPKSFKALQQIREQIRFLVGGAHIMVNSHASSEGTDKNNMELSQMRRGTVIALLQHQSPLDLTLSGQAFGESESQKIEASAKGDALTDLRAHNRRVDLVIIPAMPYIPKTKPSVTREDLLRIDPSLIPKPPTMLEQMLKNPPESYKPKTPNEMWQEGKRNLIDGALKGIGLGKDVRDFLTPRLSGLVDEGLKTGAEDLLKSRGLNQNEVDAIMKAIEAGSKTEWKK